MKKMEGTEKKRGGEERIEKKKIERAKERVKNFECMQNSFGYTDRWKIEDAGNGFKYP